MKAHIGADVESGLVHYVHGNAVHVADVIQVAELLYGEENAITRMLDIPVSRSVKSMKIVS